MIIAILIILNIIDLVYYSGTKISDEKNLNDEKKQKILNIACIVMNVISFFFMLFLLYKHF